MKKPPVVRRLEIRYQDLDPYGHVNNAVYLQFFESLRFAYWRALAEVVGVSEFEAGGIIPGGRYVIAETTVRYRAELLFGDELHGAASIRSVGNRSFVMDYELRKGPSFAGGSPVADGSAVHVFYDMRSGRSRPRPGWFLPAVAELEGRPERDFAPEGAG